MYKVNIICKWQLKFELELNEPVDLFVDIVDFKKTDRKKVLLLIEPDELTNFSKKVIKDYQQFAYILTHDEKILAACPNAILFEFGTSWIRDYNFPEKEFSISTVVGVKKKAFGHRLRKELWKRRKEIINFKKFYVSKRGMRFWNKLFSYFKYKDELVLGESKWPLFESQFHIVIENIGSKFWFTEKLIDCFQTKTVPIYWGCTNIGDYFNPQGMFIVKNVDEIIEVCNQLDPNTYQSLVPYIEENFERSKNYLNLDERVKSKLAELMPNS